MKKLVILCVLVMINSPSAFGSAASSMCIGAPLGTSVNCRNRDMDQVQLTDNLKQAMTSQGQDMTSDVREAIVNVRNNNEDLVQALVQVGHTEAAATELATQVSGADDLTIIALLLELNK